jgi:hypothetical protein
MKKKTFYSLCRQKWNTVDFFYQPWPERALLWFWASILNAEETSWKSSSSGSLYCTSAWYIHSHGLINYKDTKTKCCLYWCLIEFIDWRYGQSCWYFRPCFVNYCPSNLLYGSPPPPLPPFPKSKYSIYRQYVAGRGWGCWVLLEAIFCRSLTLGFWPDSEPTKLVHHPMQT